MRFLVECRRDEGNKYTEGREVVAEFSEPGYEALELGRLLTAAKGVISVVIRLQPETTLMEVDNGGFEHVGED